MTSQNNPSSSSTLLHLFRRTAVALLLTLGLPAAVHAAKVATVDLAGATFAHGVGVSRTSSPTTLEAQARYYYRIEGTVHGTGSLAFVIPNGTPIATLLEQIEPGSSAALQGFHDNVGGALPFTFINQHYDGNQSTAFGTFHAVLDIIGSVDAGGIVHFDVSNVVLTLNGAPVAGSVVFEAGSKAIIGVPPKFQFSLAAPSVAENAGTLVLTVSRTDNSEGSHQVSFAATPGSATTPGDYTLAAGTLSFGNGVLSQTITVNLTNDGTAEPNENFTVTLSGPTLGAELGTQASTTVTITDDDIAGTPGVLSFAVAQEALGEAAGTVNVSVVRTGGTTGQVTVDFAASVVAGAQAATPGSDFSLVAGTLTFAAGQTQKNISVTITDDGASEVQEAFGITLSNPTGGATLGGITNHRVDINDNDAALPVLAFASAGDSYSEGVGQVQIAVVRTGDTTASVSVNFAFAGIAGGLPDVTPGTDFTPAAGGTLTFASGETSKSIVLTITDDTDVEGNEEGTFVLSGPTGGAVLGTNQVHSFSVVDNDAPFTPENATFTGMITSNGYGLVHFKTTALGGISGALLADGVPYKFKGSLSATGGFTKSLKPVAARAAGISLNIQIGAGGEDFLGSFGAAALIGEKDKTTNIASVGDYTATLGVDNLTAGGGPLTGYLTLTVSDKGAVKFKGFLPDGAKVMGASNVSVNDHFPLVAGLYKKKAGFLSIDAALLSNGDGTFSLDFGGTWTKPPGSTGIYGSAGLANVPVNGAGRLYVQPPAGSRVLSDLDSASGSAFVNLSAGNLAAPIGQAVTVSTANKVTVNTPGADKLKVKIKSAKGTFSGSFMDGATLRKFKGACIQGPANQNEQFGTGFFIGTDVAGLVLFSVD